MAQTLQRDAINCIKVCHHLFSDCTGDTVQDCCIHDQDHKCSCQSRSKALKFYFLCIRPPQTEFPAAESTYQVRGGRRFHEWCKLRLWNCFVEKKGSSDHAELRVKPHLGRIAFCMQLCILDLSYFTVLDVKISADRRLGL